ncbi:MAG: SDR family oxidoreductase [Candidatus Lambdaproteobacteria bacterium]|nr:SDR family oxidoreductase [Candidatus Lambdaproteobacteria bacterium]
MAEQQAVALVTGGGGGLGRAVCLALGQTGAHVVANDRDEARAEACAQALQAAGHAASAAAGNVSSAEAVDALKAQIIQRFGRLDILVNMAGNVANDLLVKVKDEDFIATLDAHLRSTLNCMRAFAPLMRERSYGRIVNMSSVAALGIVGGTSYSAAKGAIEALSRTAAMELARYGITVNCVAPGLINAGMFLTNPEHFRQAGIARTPMGRPGEPEEVAAAIRFLASREAGYITGQTLLVCGGLSVGV